MMTSSNGNISALLAFCVGNSPVTGEFPTQRSVKRSFDVFLNLRHNKRLSEQSLGWWSETPSCSLWRHCNVRTVGGTRWCSDDKVDNITIVVSQCWQIRAFYVWCQRYQYYFLYHVYHIPFPLTSYFTYIFVFDTICFDVFWLQNNNMSIFVKCITNHSFRRSRTHAKLMLSHTITKWHSARL